MYEISGRPVFDEVDAKIRDERILEWDARPGPRVGDFVVMPDGEYRRFAHDWGDDIQTTCKGIGGSFYFYGSCMSMSGSLDRAIPKAHLIELDEVRDGSAWFFHHNHVGAHRGVYFTVPCRVFRYEPKASERQQR